MANKKTRKNGEGTLFKRSDGRWQASFVPENGKRLYFYGKTKAEALEKLRKAQQEDQKGLLATGPKQGRTTLCGGCTKGPLPQSHNRLFGYK